MKWIAGRAHRRPAMARIEMSKVTISDFGQTYEIPTKLDSDPVVVLWNNGYRLVGRSWPRMIPGHPVTVLVSRRRFIRWAKGM